MCLTRQWQMWTEQMSKRSDSSESQPAAAAVRQTSPDATHLNLSNSKSSSKSSSSSSSSSGTVRFSQPVLESDRNGSIGHTTMDSSKPSIQQQPQQHQQHQLEYKKEEQQRIQNHQYNRDEQHPPSILRDTTAAAAVAPELPTSLWGSVMMPIRKLWELPSIRISTFYGSANQLGRPVSKINAEREIAK